MKSLWLAIALALAIAMALRRARPLSLYLAHLGLRPMLRDFDAICAAHGVVLLGGQRDAARRRARRRRRRVRARGVDAGALRRRARPPGIRHLGGALLLQVRESPRSGSSRSPSTSTGALRRSTSSRGARGRRGSTSPRSSSRSGARRSTAAVSGYRATRSRTSRGCTASGKRRWYTRATEKKSKPQKKRREKKSKDFSRK